MKRIHLLLVGIFLAILIASCSTKQDKYLNRNYHSITAGYNLIFNGEVSLEEGKEALIVDYVDDFWNILPVERIHISKAIDREIGYEETPTLFSRAEEKAIIAIQKHSMFIDGKERNPRIAEAYLLLGKSRYYDSRFIPAIDAFNFILTKYPASTSINEANIWRGKTYVRLENEEVAIDILKQTLKRKDLKKETLAEASIMIAQAYIQMDSLPEALPYVHQAAMNTGNGEKKGRYSYIEGQLYSRLNKPDSAAMAFDRVIDLHRRTLRNYYIHAHLEKINHTAYTSKEEKKDLEKLLLKLAEDRENRPYLDHIHHSIAKFYSTQDSIGLAETHFNKSIEEYKEDKKLQALNYNSLAEINFKRSHYKEAGALYENALNFIEPNTLEYRQTKRKRDNLEDVIKYESIVSVTDSIIGLVKMSPAEQLAYFTKYTDSLRQTALSDSISKIQREQSASRAAGANFRKEAGKTVSDFSFYDAGRAAQGKLDFEQVWGRRVLEDYWRLSNKRSGAGFEQSMENIAVVIQEEQIYNPQAYLDAIPTDKAVVDSILSKRDFAYYQLGLIYKEKFKDNTLAASRLEQLLENKPEERLVLPAKYHLYRIYEAQGDTAKTSSMRNEILSGYPDSRYAEIINNPTSLQKEDENSPEYHYNQTFKLFREGAYDLALEQTETFLNRFMGDEIASKFELLKATLIGRMQGYDAYEAALSYVALNYPNTEEGKQAERIHTQDLPKLAFTGFTDEAEDTSRWKLVYSFAQSDKQDAEDLKRLLNIKKHELGYTGLDISLDYYIPEKFFVVVHGLESKGAAEALTQELFHLEKQPVQQASFEISSSNYAKILVHKNLDAYITKE